MPEPPTLDPHLFARATRRGFAVRVVVLRGFGRLPFDERQWWDCLVEVESGQLELQLESGRRLLWEAGTLLSFTGLRIRALHNPGRECTSLVALSRRPLSADGTRPLSRPR
jgi:hypothetical protein